MTDMIRKTISIPEPMAAFIKGRLKSGLYGNDSEYFRELVRRDQERQNQQASKAAFENMIQESIASGHTDMTLDEIIIEAQSRAKADETDGV